MKRTSLFPRLAAAALALALLLTPARALTVEQARELLAENYLEPIDQAVLDLPTVADILEALGDPYTEYLDPQTYADFMASMADAAVGGIGVTSSMTPEGLLVSDVIDGSPAQKGGILPGDVLVAVDGVSVVGMELEEAVALIRGAEGTRVSVTYLRSGGRRTVTLTRTTIVLPATTGRLLEGGVGYIDCDTWGEDTLGHFQSLMEQMEPQVGCWLIDLRSNTGGFTTAATDAAGLFCGAGPMLSLRLRADADQPTADGYAYYTYDTQDRAMTQKPAVILVDGYTASASEAFCAALRDYDRAVIVGERTFGKGVAQGLWDRETHPDYFPDDDCLKITVARFYSPIGNTNHIIGVMPDFLVSDDQTEETGYALAQLMAQAGEDWPLAVDELLERQITDYIYFSDIEGERFEYSIAALAAYGLVSGKGDGQFHSGDTLTRAELAQLLQNVLGYALADASSPFTDVAGDAWYAQAAATMDSLGLMAGTGEGRFSPDRVLTHQELFTVLARLGRWLNDDLDLTVRAAGAERSDLHVLSGYDDWAKAPVWLLSCALEDGRGTLINLLWDEPEAIRPTAPATRGETAEALYSLLYYLDILP